MEKIITADGSITFYSDRFKEHYHSKSGAEEEALMKYAGPCELKERAKEGRLRILDFCFGLGYNAAAAIDIALSANPECIVEVVGLENDDNILNEIASLKAGFGCYTLIKKTIASKAGVGYFHNEGNVSVRIILGDAKVSCTNLPSDYFDAVLFDPFSPAVCPDLWDKAVFSEMYRILKSKGRLTTYSYARKVRDGLNAVGFIVED
jgi:tRNA U34 5-methylaminomethyl-2-thiouridine-forming methyltransferase MnmC